jgi:hypothetical protein
MAAITDLSDLVNLATGGNGGAPETIHFFKDGRVDAAAATAPVAGRFHSLWMYEGSPSGGAAPGATVLYPNNTVAGGMFQTNPAGGKQKWLTGFFAVSNIQGTLVLYDRIAHRSGLNATTITAQTFSMTPTRYTNGVGNEIWLEIYSLIGTTATTITAEYTDQSGNTGAVTTATTFGGTGLREAQRMIPLPLAAGDSGVRSVANVDLLATTGTAGDFGVTLVHPLASLPIPLLGCGVYFDILRQAPIEIATDACLGLAFFANTTTVPNIFGSLTFVEK